MLRIVPHTVPRVGRSYEHVFQMDSNSTSYGPTGKGSRAPLRRTKLARTTCAAGPRRNHTGAHTSVLLNSRLESHNDGGKEARNLSAQLKLIPFALEEGHRVACMDILGYNWTGSLLTRFAALGRALLNETTVESGDISEQKRDPERFVIG